MQVREYTTRLGHTGTRHAIRAASVLLLAGIAFAGQLHAAANSLVDISHVTLPGNKQQLALTMSGPAEAPTSFTIDNPARIALDLPDTANEMDEKRVAISSGLLQNVTMIEAGGRTRVVVNLTALAPYTTAVRGNQLLLTLDADGDSNGISLAQADTGDKPKTAIDSSSGPIEKRVNQIESMDFRRGPMGEGRVIFDLSSVPASSPICVRRAGG